MSSTRRTTLWTAVPGTALGFLLTFGTGLALGQESGPEVTLREGSEMRCELHVQGIGLQGSGREETRLSLVVTEGFDADAWSERLTDRDIDAREVAYRELLALARRGRAARLALESWAVDPTALELAWTARLALRELRVEGAARVENPRWIVLRDPADPNTPRQVETLVPPPRGAGPTSLGPVAETDSLRNIDIAAGAPFDAPGVRSLYSPRAFVFRRVPIASRIQSLREFKLDVRPEGVILLVVDHTPERTRSFEYAGESLSALIEEHPDLRHGVPGLVNLALKPLAPGFHLSWGTGKATLFRTDGGALVAPRVDPSGGVGDLRPVIPGTARVELRHDILGVKCTPVSSLEEVDNDLGPGVGLRIEYREHGTIASELGLMRGDILVELCGEQLCHVDDITRIMNDRTGDEVEVKILDRSGQERTLLWAPKATAVIHQRSPDGAKDE